MLPAHHVALPNGIRGLAARYLGAVKALTALTALERAAGDKDDVVGQGAIDALADLGGAGGRAALAKIQKSGPGDERRRLAREALARLDQAASATPEPLSTPPGPI